MAHTWIVEYWLSVSNWLVFRQSLMDGWRKDKVHGWFLVAVVHPLIKYGTVECFLIVGSVTGGKSVLQKPVPVIARGGGLS